MPQLSRLSICCAWSLSNESRGSQIYVVRCYSDGRMRVYLNKTDWLVVHTIWWIARRPEDSSSNWECAELIIWILTKIRVAVNWSMIQSWTIYLWSFIIKMRWAGIKVGIVRIVGDSPNIPWRVALVSMVQKSVSWDGVGMTGSFLCILGAVPLNFIIMCLHLYKRFMCKFQ